ncbi:IS110 family transposase [Parvibacter caecicola]|uniref:IS110 family transposase n=1 Tax=Parvibacter caecicola TaxID=747645 RepID=UPI0027310476|nr:IS110 family transposase [Parvibacter caecicola]
MFWVGIDVSKDSHSIAFLGASGELLRDVFEVSNDSAGFGLLEVASRSLSASPSDFLFCMESTGRYWKNLHRFLVSKGFPVCVVNPSRVAAFRRASDARNAKTDTADALAIARFACAFDLVAPSAPDREGLKRLTRFRASLVKERTQLKNRLAASVSEVFPALPALLGGTSSASFAAVVSAYPTSELLASADPCELFCILSTASRGRYKRDKVPALIAAAKENCGSCDPCLVFEFQQLVQMITFYSDKISAVDREIAELSACPERVLLSSIPGIGVYGAAVILAETGDPSRFPAAKSLMAFAGMDATVVQSGHYVGKDAHMTKRGSSYLRYILMMCADAARRSDPYFGDYYKALRERGKHHYVAVSACARKLCGVILAVLREQRPYERREPVSSRKPSAV